MRKFLAAALAALLTLTLGACGNGGDAASGASSAAPDLDGLFTELSALCGEAAVDIDPATAAGLYGVEESEVFACRAAGGVKSKLSSGTDSADARPEAMRLTVFSVVPVPLKYTAHTLLGCMTVPPLFSIYRWVFTA